jgi:cytochrome c-type biogenesis protein CcmE
LFSQEKKLEIWIIKVNKRQKKIATILCLFTILGFSVFVILYALRDNVIFFYSPSDVKNSVLNGKIQNNSLIRLGGLVLDKSFYRDEDGIIFFSITDNANVINVSYSGILPDLFREGQGVIAEGYIESDTKDGDLSFRFNASTVLAKHDENYMPPEVYDVLKRGY